MVSKKDFNISPARLNKLVKLGQEQYDKYKNLVKTHNQFVVIDMTQPSYKKRFIVYNMHTNTVVRQHHTSHGVNSSNRSNRAYAKYFSNKIMSKKSNAGALVTGKVYYGRHGRSLNLHGLEKGINNNAFKRRIVIHKAKYCTDPYILRNGRAGQSWGCPALDPAVCQQVIDLIKGGTLVYIHTKD